MPTPFAMPRFGSISSFRLRPLILVSGWSLMAFSCSGSSEKKAVQEETPPNQPSLSNKAGLPPGDVTPAETRVSGDLRLKSEAKRS